MSDLSKRQRKILLAIVEEYMHSYQEVGSAYLVRTHHLDISSATVRNEMVKLMKKGYLKKMHTSSGRYPTDEAIKLYVEGQLDRFLKVIDEVNLKQEIFRYRFEKQRLVDEILKQLSNYVGAMSFMFFTNTQKYYGISYLLNYLEWRDIDMLKSITRLLDDTALLRNVVEQADSTLRSEDSDGVRILIGGDLGLGKFNECAVAFVNTPFWDDDFTVGVFGSKRLNYKKAIPALKLVKQTIETSLRGWN